MPGIRLGATAGERGSGENADAATHVVGGGGADADATSSAGAELTDLALRLARIHGWLQLQPPIRAGGVPYRLALQNAATGQIKKEGETFGGEKYRVVLTADPKELDRLDAQSGVRGAGSMSS